MTACAADRAASRGAAPVAVAPPAPERRAPARDPDEGMTVQSEHGYLGEEEVHEAIRRRWTQLTRCYGEAGDAQGFAEGPVKLRFTVGTDGRTTAAHVVFSRLGSFEVERCLVNIARTIQFARPEGGTATVEYSMQFRSTGEVPMVEVGTVDEDQVGELFRALAKDCRDLGVDEATATVYVGADGRVRSAGLASRRAMSDDTAACVWRSLRAWTVPVDVHGRAVARLELSLPNTAVLEPPAAPTRFARGKRVAQGQRPARRRR